ncbi:MAG: murein hydrolase activator EnvC family protein [Acidimicrobiales bacterium]
MASLLVVVLVSVGGAPVAAAGPVPSCATRRYLAPVPDPVDVGFHLPQGQYGPGNRGLEYATPADRIVKAMGAGEVSFAGTVAGERHVSVRHPDGLISSYAYLATISVSRGQSVLAGQEVGRSGGRFQLGVRRDGDYIDPAPLLARTLRPRLVGAAAVARCSPPVKAAPG